MSHRELIGGLELLVLLALIRLGDEAYGVPIAETISVSSKRDVAIGSVYITLERLRVKGFVSTRLGEPTAARGGRAKTYFRITAKGLRAVRRTQSTLIDLWSGVPLLEGARYDVASAIGRNLVARATGDWLDGCEAAPDKPGGHGFVVRGIAGGAG